MLLQFKSDEYGGNQYGAFRMEFWLAEMVIAMAVNWYRTRLLYKMMVSDRMDECFKDIQQSDLLL